MPKLKDLIPPEKLPKKRKEQFSEARPIIDGNGDKVGEYNEIIYNEENIAFNACKAMYDELEIEVDWETMIEFIANHLTEESTNGECCLPDLTQESRARMIGRAEKIVQAIASSLSKIIK